MGTLTARAPSTKGDKQATLTRAAGKQRAAEVVALLDPITLQKRTTPEAIVEAYLIKRGVQFEAQVELGFARPDFVLFHLPDVSGGAMALNVNGEHWHRDTLYADMAKGRAMVNVQVNGIPIVKYLEVWEKDINSGEMVLDDALRGVAWRSA